MLVSDEKTVTLWPYSKVVSCLESTQNPGMALLHEAGSGFRRLLSNAGLDIRRRFVGRIPRIPQVQMFGLGIKWPNWQPSIIEFQRYSGLFPSRLPRLALTYASNLAPPPNPQSAMHTIEWPSQLEQSCLCLPACLHDRDPGVSGRNGDAVLGAFTFMRDACCDFATHRAHAALPGVSLWPLLMGCGHGDMYQVKGCFSMGG